MSLDYCIQEARKLPRVKDQQRHYAVVVDGKGRVISEGTNSYIKTHTMMHKASRKLGLEKDFCHAEQLALSRARGRGCKLIVVRIDAKAQPCYSEPCPVCKLLIKEAGHIKAVEFTV
jgi:deoxycytidylate deaminase